MLRENWQRGLVMFKVICVAGMVRSGSMWTFNVVRELARRSGYRVLPEEVKLAEKEWFEYTDRELTNNPDPKAVFVLKTHLRMRTCPPDCLIISNIRDVRDVLMSYQRFMHVDFDQALEDAKEAAATSDHYAAFPEEQRMCLRYDRITEAPDETIGAIAARMGLMVDDSTVSEIAAMFGKERVRSLTEERDQRCRATIATGREPAGEVLLARADGDYATIDLSTGFQSNHVSDYREGDWRQLVSDDQTMILNQTFGDWLKRHQFAL